MGNLMRNENKKWSVCLCKFNRKKRETWKIPFPNSHCKVELPSCSFSKGEWDTHEKLFLGWILWPLKILTVFLDTHAGSCVMDSRPFSSLFHIFFSKSHLKPKTHLSTLKPHLSAWAPQSFPSGGLMLLLVVSRSTPVHPGLCSWVLGRQAAGWAGKQSHLLLISFLP